MHGQDYRQKDGSGNRPCRDKTRSRPLTYRQRSRLMSRAVANVTAELGAGAKPRRAAKKIQAERGRVPARMQFYGRFKRRHRAVTKLSAESCLEFVSHRFAPFISQRRVRGGATHCLNSRLTSRLINNARTLRLDWQSIRPAPCDCRQAPLFRVLFAVELRVSWI